LAANSFYPRPWSELHVQIASCDARARRARHPVRRSERPPRSAVAGTAFEKLTGKTIYQALEDDLARPLGMQDFDRSKQGKVPSPGSVHPEYVMRLSTRDLARVGQLMLRNGRWNGTPLLPAEWVR